MSEHDASNAQDERLDFGKVLPIFAIVFVDMLGLTIILPLLHIYAIRYGADATTIGLLAATYPACQFIGAPLLGRLSDRYGRKPILLLSQIGTLIGFILLAASNTLWMVFLSRAIDGFTGGNIAVAQAALTDITPKRHRTRALGLTGAAFGLAFILGPVIAILSLEISGDNYALPAASAAVYSGMAILLTLILFKETHADNTATTQRSLNPFVSIWHGLNNPLIAVLLVLIFAQQFVFFAFESLVGVFTLNRLGFSGTGNALLFIYVGLILVAVQMGYIGRWSNRYGDRRVILGGLALLGVGLLMTAITPEQPLPGYSPLRMRLALQQAHAGAPTRAETLNPRDIAVDIPDGENTGLVGVLWLAVAMVPVSVGAAVLRPSINSLITKRVPMDEVGGILGVSAALVSSANAISPIVGGYFFEQNGSSAPFLYGGVALIVLVLVSVFALKSRVEDEQE